MQLAKELGNIFKVDELPEWKYDIDVGVRSARNEPDPVSLCTQKSHMNRNYAPPPRSKRLMNNELSHDKRFLNVNINVNKSPTRCDSMQIFIYCKVTLYVSGVTAPNIRSRVRVAQTSPDQATLEGSSCTGTMTCTGGCGYSF